MLGSGGGARVLIATSCAPRERVMGTSMRASIVTCFCVWEARVKLLHCLALFRDRMNVTSPVFVIVFFA